MLSAGFRRLVFYFCCFSIVEELRQTMYVEKDYKIVYILSPKFPHKLILCQICDQLPS